MQNNQENTLEVSSQDSHRGYDETGIRDSESDLERKMTYMNLFANTTSSEEELWTRLQSMETYYSNKGTDLTIPEPMKILPLKEEEIDKMMANLMNRKKEMITTILEQPKTVEFNHSKINDLSEHNNVEKKEKSKCLCGPCSLMADIGKAMGKCMLN